MRTSIPRALCAFAVLACASPALAGDVTAKLKNGSLIITGGNSGDVITVTVTDAGPATIQVAPGAGTSVNGQGNPAVLTPVTQDVRIDLGAGDDSLEVHGTFPRDLRVELGAGYDALTVDTATISRDCTIDFGELWAVSSLGQVEVLGDLSVRFGDQGPMFTAFDLFDCHVVGKTVMISGPSVASHSFLQCFFDSEVRFRQTGGATRVLLKDSTVNGALSVRSIGGAAVSVVDAALNGDIRLKNSGGARCVLDVFSSEIDGNVALRASAGEVILTLTEFISTGGARVDVRGNASASLSMVMAFFETNVVVRAGSGADSFGLLNSTVLGDVTADVGDGDDQVALGVVECNRVRVRTGAGNDSCSGTAASHFASFRAEASDGSDVISIQDATIDGDAVLSLAGGSNWAVAKNAAVGGDLRITAGNEHDVIDLTGTTVTGTKKVKTGGGNDTLID